MTIHQSDRQTKVTTSHSQSMLVPFHGSSLYLVEHQGQPYVPMKPVIEGMGLAWAAQFVKLKSKFSKGISEIEIPSAGGNQVMICLPLRKLPAWLYSIQPNKVAPEIRPAVIAYQEECDEVLWQYWTKGKAERATVKPAVASYLPEYRKARAIKISADAITLALSQMPNLSPEAKQAALARAVNDVAGQDLLPLPVIHEHYHSAAEAGAKLGISANKVGRLANAHSLKTERHGKFFIDKSPNSSKQVESFRYNEAGLQALRLLLTATETGGEA